MTSASGTGQGGAGGANETRPIGKGIQPAARAGVAGWLVIASSSASSQLTSAHFGKYHFADGGSDLIEVRLGAGEKDAGRWLHVEGKQSAVTAIEASGRILRGLTLLLHDDAQVLIDHGPGFVLAWLSDTDGNTAIGAGLSQRRVKLPAHLALEGSAVSLRLTLPHAEGMTLSSDIPLIVRVRAPGQPERLRLFRNAVDLPLYLPAGENTLHLDSTTASPLGGHVDIHRVDVDALEDVAVVAHELRAREAVDVAHARAGRDAHRVRRGADLDPVARQRLADGLVRLNELERR